MAEKRTDPVDGSIYTYDELAAWYKGTYKKKQIEEYWEHTCYVKAGKKAKGKAAPKKKDGYDEGEKPKAGAGRSGPRKTLTFKHIFTKRNPGKLDDFYEVDQGVWGEGAFGQVVRGTDKNTKQERAIKVMDISKIQDKERFELEIRIQQELSHPNIVKLFETFKDARSIYLVMELCNGGMLCDWLEDAEFFSEKCAASYMRQLMSAVNYLHASELVHRDIKPENILLLSEDEGAPIKLIDFGAARKYTVGSGPTMKSVTGTITHISPQVVLEKGYDEKCDIWSCGILCYNMLSGDLPFLATTDGEIKRKIREGKFEFPDSDWEEVSDHGKDFITQMLTYDAKKRPSASAVLQHKWVDESDPPPEVDIAKDLGERLKSFKAASKLKRVALTVIAKQLSVKHKDVEQLKLTFEALDSNKDGTVNPKEMRVMMEKHDIAIPPDLDDLLKSCDSDGSGEIDYCEFLASTVQATTYRRKSVMWAAFRTFDTDGDGVISKKDLATLLQDDEGASSSTVKAVFASKNSEGPGDTDTISFEEFTDLVAGKLEDGSEMKVVETPASTDGANPTSTTGKRKSVTFGAGGVPGLVPPS